MKNALKSLLPFLLAAPAFAHSNALPHTHEAGHTNWLPAFLCIAALTATLGLIAYKRKAAKNR